MRITNVNTLSALLDRMIVENIKRFFFEKDNLIENVNHQELIISEIKKELEELFLTQDYRYLSEKRTFAQELLVNLDELVKNNCHIGESDRMRLDETKKDNPNVNTFIQQEKRLRTANEGRSRNKNKIDETFKELWKK